MLWSQIGKCHILDIQIAKIFHVSTDYLLGLETPAGLDLSGLTEEEKTCIRNLIQAMKHRK